MSLSVRGHKGLPVCVLSPRSEVHKQIDRYTHTHTLTLHQLLDLTILYNRPKLLIDHFRGREGMRHIRRACRCLCGCVAIAVAGGGGDKSFLSRVFADVQIMTDEGGDAYSSLCVCVYVCVCVCVCVREWRPERKRRKRESKRNS